LGIISPTKRWVEPTMLEAYIGGSCPTLLAWEQMWFFRKGGRSKMGRDDFGNFGGAVFKAPVGRQ
jgi:hypothetical protein